MNDDPAEYLLDPPPPERKTRRTVLLLPESLHKRVKSAARKKNESFNSFTQKALENSLKPIK